jgi:hypothetical protein
MSTGRKKRQVTMEDSSTTDTNEQQKEIEAYEIDSQNDNEQQQQELHKSSPLPTKLKKERSMTTKDAIDATNRNNGNFEMKSERRTKSAAYSTVSPTAAAMALTERVNSEIGGIGLDPDSKPPQQRKKSGSGGSVAGIGVLATKKKRSKSGKSPSVSSQRRPAAFDIVATLSDEELTKFQEFHEIVHERSAWAQYEREEREWLDDGCLVRYLRARDWNIPQAHKMLLESVRWRFEYRPQHITTHEIGEVLKLKGMFQNGLDREGRPVIYMKPGAYNPNSAEMRVRFLVWTLERAIASMDVVKGVEKITWVMDFSVSREKKVKIEKRIGRKLITISLSLFHIGLWIKGKVGKPSLFVIGQFSYS